MKNIFKVIFEPLYFLYQRRISDKIITFLRKHPIFQYLLALLISVALLYFAAVVYDMAA